MIAKMTPPEPILHTKLLPPRLRTGLVRRDALFAQLDDGLARKMTLIHAPTGFGKTTLVSAWLTERGLPAAWVTLDETDNDPVRFWTYIVSALRGLDASLGKAALSALAAPAPPASFEPLLTQLINELSQRTVPCVLVLEDYHLIRLDEIHTALTFLLQHLPATLHLILVSRSEPDLPLGILRARDELLELTAPDLRFSPEETASFLRGALREPLSAAAVESLQERTEGWAAGLRLAALVLQQKHGDDTARVLASFSGSHRYVADYLTNEVFAGQPEAVQTFLLATCFLGRLTGTLCDAVTGSDNGLLLLDQLERHDLFIVRLTDAGGRVWYRYNPLFAESVQVLSRQRLGEAGVQAVFERASIWYAQQRMFDEAIEAALSAGLFEQALTLLGEFIEIYGIAETHTLRRWLERIPVGSILQRPTMCVTAAQVILFTSDRYAAATAARIEPYLLAAEQVWRAESDDENLGIVLALRGMMLLWQGQFQQALACVGQALDLMAEDEVFWRGVSLLNAAGGDMNVGRLAAAQGKILEARAFLGATQNTHGLLAATGMLAEILYQQGHLEHAAQLCRQLMDEAVGDESMLDDQGEARRILANVAYEQNDLESAGRYAAEALEMAHQRSNELLAAQAQGCLSAVHLAQGRKDQARGDALALAARLNNRLAQRELQDTQIWLALCTDEWEAFTRWQPALDDENLLHQQRERQRFLSARLRIRQGHASEALGLLEILPAEATHSLVQALILRALALRTLGDLKGAAAELAQALEMGQDQGFRRLFLDEGVLLASLLRELLPAHLPADLSLYAAMLLRLFPLEASPTRQGVVGAGALVEPLSGQELRVLRLLAAGLSNSEIAGELVVSNNTVKTHLKNIYRKLNVNARDEARALARELKLI